MTGGSDRFEGKNSRNDGMCLFLEPGIFGEAKSTDSSAMGVWTGGRPDAFSKNAFFRNPLPRTESEKNGAGKNSRSFCLARAESIPAVFSLLLVSPP